MPGFDRFTQLRHPRRNGGERVGWSWKVFGMSRQDRSGSSYQAGDYLPSREAALSGPYTVDGRTLDRAEYIVAPISGRYDGIP